jgi:hypothetical protein
MPPKRNGTADQPVCNLHRQRAGQFFAPVVNFPILHREDAGMTPAAAPGVKATNFARIVALAALLLFALGVAARAQTEPLRKLTWHPLEFAILRYNDDAPKSWNIYHSDKKGVLLVRLWKRYLLVSVQDEEVYDIDPQTIKASGDSVEWSYADRPAKPIETPDWRERNVCSMDRVRFRLGTNGHFLELQLPLGPNGRPIY